jgi:hypothetical protein
MITLDTIFRSVLNFKTADGKPTLSQEDLVKNFRSLQKIIPNTPEDPAYKRLYTFLYDFLKKCESDILELPSYDYTKKYFEDREGNEAVLAVLERIKKERPCEGEEFRSILREYKEDQALDELEYVLNNVNKIARVGLEVGQGRKKTKLEGLEAAIGYFAEKSRNLRQNRTGIVTQSQIISKKSSESVKKKYQQVKTEPEDVMGIPTGIDAIDKNCNGLGRSQLMLVGAFTAHGKTTFSMNMAYQAIISGWNTCYVSLEMSHDEIRDKFYVLHTCHPKFRILYPHLSSVVGKININDVTYGLLKDEEEELFYRASEDFGDVENNGYGYCDLWQPESTTTTLSDIEFHLLDVQQQFKAHERDLEFCVIDYITLLGIDKTVKSHDHKQDMNNTIKSLKRTCLTFNNGAGIRMVSPFQISRRAFLEAKKNEGRYDSTALGDYNEAERSADIVVSLYVDEEMRESGQSRIQNLKSRRDKYFPTCIANVNQANGCITDRIDLTDEDPVEIVGQVYGL